MLPGENFGQLGCLLQQGSVYDAMLRMLQQPGTDQADTANAGDMRFQSSGIAWKFGAAECILIDRRMSSCRVAGKSASSRDFAKRQARPGFRRNALQSASHRPP